MSVSERFDPEVPLRHRRAFHLQEILTLGDIGEKDILKRLFPLLPEAQSALLGPGDDAAVLSAEDKRFVVSTDMMVEGADFFRQWSAGSDLGWKAAATNLSDIAAMGAKPTALVVGLALPRNTEIGVLESIARGFYEACMKLAPGCGIVGGDLSVSSTAVISVTAFGDLEGRAPVKRSGATPGDILALCGSLGLSSQGFELLNTQARNAQGEPDADACLRLRKEHPRIVEAHLRPAPAISQGVRAAAAGASAMIDISDGLACDALRIAQASNVKIVFDARTLGSGYQRILQAAEDHSLLASFPPKAILPASFHQIGVVEEGSGVFCDEEPVSHAFTVGWDPYHVSHRHAQ